MRVLFAGTPAPAVPSLNALVGSRHEVVGVATRPDAPTGRGRRLVPSPVGARADELGLPVMKTAGARSPEFADWVRGLDVDVAVVVAWGALVPQVVLDIPAHGWLNLHFSVLPRWRGAAPVQRALMAGDETTGASVFRLVPQLDAGPVYRSRSWPVQADDTAGLLLDRLAVDGAGLLLESLDAVESGEQPVPQPEDGVTLAPKITVEEARIDWGRPASEIVRLVRGTNPAPGAWTTLHDERFKVLVATPVDTDPLQPGELRVTKRELLVGAGDGALRLDQVQAVGKKPMAGADWARGVSLVEARFA